MSSIISSTTSQTTSSFGQTGQSTDYASMFGTLADRLHAMSADDRQSALDDISKQSPALAQRLSDYMAMSPSQQQAELAKMGLTAQNSTISDMVANLATMSPINQTSELKQIASSDAQLAATLRMLLNMSPADRQSALAKLAQGASASDIANMASGQTSGNVAAADGSTTQTDVPMPGSTGLDKLQADEVAAQARSQMEQMMASNDSGLLDAFLGGGNGSDGGYFADAAANSGSDLASLAGGSDMSGLTGTSGQAGLASLMGGSGSTGSDSLSALMGGSDSGATASDSLSALLGSTGTPSTAAMSAYLSNLGSKGL